MLASNALPASPFPARFELSSLLAANGGDGTDGFVIKRILRYDLAGYSVSGAGDVNGDGVDDFIVGAPYLRLYDPDNIGHSYVVFGTGDGFPAELQLSSLNGTDGFALNGLEVDFDRSGFSVSRAGDVNGDGIGDVLIGDPRASQGYVVFGSSTGFRAVFELSSLFADAGGDGTKGFVLTGCDENDACGYSVSDAGDVNGDGIDDVIFGARDASPEGGESYTGQSYVVFGTQAGFPAEITPASLDGTHGFALNGISADDLVGSSVSGAGDLNDDGIDDLIIGAQGADPGGRSNAGESYVVFGTGNGFPAALELSALDGSNGFVLRGIAPGDRSGAVSAAGDVNGDGIDDVVIGAYAASPHGTDKAGESYVVFGDDAGFPAVFELASLDGTNGFAAEGTHLSDRAGTSVGNAGDLNGDGVDDVIIGAETAHSGAHNDQIGKSYVVFGSNGGFPASLELSELDGTDGFVLNGSLHGDGAGAAVGSAGDVNGDGIDDVIIGAPSGGLPGMNEAYAAYVVYGRGAVPDTDADGVPDDADNCSEVANADQRDSNSDGFGNVCDADLNNDCIVNFRDLGLMKSVFFGTHPDADLTGDGFVNFRDLGLLKKGFFQPPGPSGVPNSCDAGLLLQKGASDKTQ